MDSTIAAVVTFLFAWRSWLLIGCWLPAIAFGMWWLWWRLPKRQVERLKLAIRDAKARADVEANFRKTMGQLLGGAAVLLGAGFAYLQYQGQQTTAHNLLIRNQVSKGFEQLGSKEIVVRVGGIYALGGVMNNSEQYYLPVVEALCAFIRDNTSYGTTLEPNRCVPVHTVLIKQRKQQRSPNHRRRQLKWTS